MRWLQIPFVTELQGKRKGIYKKKQLSTLPSTGASSSDGSAGLGTSGLLLGFQHHPSPSQGSALLLASTGCCPASDFNRGKKKIKRERKDCATAVRDYQCVSRCSALQE